MEKNVSHRAATKEHNHYVPKFWIRGFADDQNRIHGWDGKSVRQVSSSKVMQTSWLYTSFDKAWRASDDLEDRLSKMESVAAPVFVAINDPQHNPSGDDRLVICAFIGLQACRHPDVMNRAHRRARELAEVYARAHDLSVDDFVMRLGGFGIGATDAAELHRMLCATTQSELAAQLDELVGLSPQDSRLPMQDALGAYALVADAIHRMQLTLLHAPANMTFVLSDTPTPQDDLSKGFAVPISKTVALLATPTAGVPTAMTRRSAPPEEVDAINQVQWTNALNIVVGADPVVLRGLTGP